MFRGYSGISREHTLDAVDVSIKAVLRNLFIAADRSNHQIWKWEIINPDVILISTMEQNCCIVIGPGQDQARRRFAEWAQNEIAFVPDFHKRILFSDETHFWLNGYVNKQNCRIWSEVNPQVYVETPLHPEKLTVGCALWAGGILLQKR
ncbi:hypothetical protein TNCV_4847151 [Trichonephila clavipes]|nr:hypothetical protein TNCV_4847151 [Trichonephila clavipes]